MILLAKRCWLRYEAMLVRFFSAIHIIVMHKAMMIIHIAPLKLSKNVDKNSEASVVFVSPMRVRICGLIDL